MSLYNPKQGCIILMHVLGNSIAHAHCPTTGYFTKTGEF